MIVQIIIGAVVVSAIILYFGGLLEDLMLIALGGVVGAAILLGMLARIIQLFKTIEIGEKSVKVMTGIIHIKSMLIPYERITHVQTTQTLSQRILGLGTLSIDTAGSDMVEVVLRDVPQKYLQKILHNIEEKTHRQVGKK